MTQRLETGDPDAVAGRRTPVSHANAVRAQFPALLALLFGNFVTGSAVLAPTAMLEGLAAGLGVTARDTGLLVTFGAVVLCAASPLTAWLTAALDRRRLLTLTLLAVAGGHLATALVGNYKAVLTIRLVMLAAVAIFTPQAASTVALMVPETRRSAAISFVFLGWSLSVAAGLPIIALMASTFGWHAAYAMLSVTALLACVATLATVPDGLRGAPLVLSSWIRLAGDSQILRLLAVTALWMSGYFLVFAFLAPCLTRLAGASTGMIAATFASMGAAGLLGNLAATRMIGSLGGFTTALVFLMCLFLGTVAWAVGHGSLGLMFVGAALLGLGFAAFNSVTQARLVAAAPALAGASVALNTSCVYIGQAIGSGLAVWLFSRSLLVAIGYGAVCFMTAALGVLFLTRTSGATDVAPEATLPDVP